MAAIWVLLGLAAAAYAVIMMCTMACGARDDEDQVRFNDERLVKLLMSAANDAPLHGYY